MIAFIVICCRFLGIERINLLAMVEMPMDRVAQRSIDRSI